MPAPEIRQVSADQLLELPASRRNLPQARQQRLLVGGIAEQVRPRLFAFEDHRFSRAGRAFGRHGTRGDIGTKRGSREAHLRCARPKIVDERPTDRSPLEIPVPIGFTPAAAHQRNRARPVRLRKSDAPRSPSVHAPAELRFNRLIRSRMRRSDHATHYRGTALRNPLSIRNSQELPRLI